MDEGKDGNRSRWTGISIPVRMADQPLPGLRDTELRVLTIVLR
jgi:hypothetical protein